MLLAGVTRVKGDAGHAGLGHQAVRQHDALALAGLVARAQFDGHRQPAALARRGGHGHSGVGIVQHRRTGAGAADLLDGAAHVQVDQRSAAFGDDRRGLAHDRRIGAEQLHAGRPFVGVQAQKLGARALVAVGEAVAGDHLGDGQPRPVTLGLQAHEPIADTGQWRQQQAIGDCTPPISKLSSMRSMGFPG